VIERYPDSRKIPDALLKIGYCNFELENWDASRTALSQVVKNYPETTPARLATQRLERMKSQGH
jgi:TolA-binding protein